MSLDLMAFASQIDVLEQLIQNEKDLQVSFSNAQEKRRAQRKTIIKSLRDWGMIDSNWLHSKVDSELASAVRLRQGPLCAKRGCRAERQEIHHLIPRSVGGPHALWNLVYLCEPCHGQEQYGPTVWSLRQALDYLGRVA